MLDNLLVLFGRFHPIIVHLPIGFILLGILIDFSRNKFQWYKEALQLIFFWAAISGLFSILSGFFQFQKEGYEWETVQAHFIVGVLTVLLSFAFYAHLKGVSFLKTIKIRVFTCAHLVLISITGHLGGTLTHGKEHLTEPVNSLLQISPIEKEKTKKYFTDYQDKTVFSSLIQPILQDKCVKCHNEKKSKGGLQLHRIEAFKKGGKNGSVLDFDLPEKSELLVRIHLPKENKKHMPPPSGKQLSKEEIQVLSRWIEEGSSFDQNLEEFNLQNELVGYFFSTEKPFYPQTEAPPPNPKVIERIRTKAISITPLHQASTFFTVSTLNYNAFSDKDFALFEGIEENIVSLDLSHTMITDSVFSLLKNYSNLTVLKLNNTKISGADIRKLLGLRHLKRLSLINSLFEEQFIRELFDFKALEKVYLFQENSSFSQPPQIQKNKIGVFDFGDYRLENFE